MQASFYTSEKGMVHCHLCPHQCSIKEGHKGLCRVRKNVNGSLQAETYGKLSAIHFDPIEKKPLYHFYPGKSILSIGSVGCNMRCKFCQNCEISQVGADENVHLENYSVTQIVAEAKQIKGNIGIAFTYNEPTVFYEFMFDVANAIHNEGLKNVMVTNGYIEPEPLQRLLPLIDGFNVDLKAFNNSFYQKHTNSSLEPVKQALIQLRKAQKHLEITNLVIPEYNDSVEEFSSMIDWIFTKLGKQTILHLSRYFPRYQFTVPATKDSLLQQFYTIAKEKLDYVYIGNVDGMLHGHNTSCSSCDAILVERSGYQINLKNLTNDGECRQCGNKSNIVC